MNRALILTSCLLLCGACGCGQSDAETLIKDQIKTMNDLAEAITKKAPEEKIKELRGQSEANKKRIEGLSISDEERQRLGDRYDVEWIKASGKLWEADVLKVDVREEVRKQQERTPW